MLKSISPFRTSELGERELFINYPRISNSTHKHGDATHACALDVFLSQVVKVSLGSGQLSETFLGVVVGLRQIFLAIRLTKNNVSIIVPRNRCISYPFMLSEKKPLLDTYVQ